MTLSIQQVIDRILAEVQVPPIEDTVDTFRAGDPSQPVTGIVSTFLASHAVLQQAADLGANLIITHEGPFYKHQVGTEWLADDPVFAAKQRLIDQHGLVIWRFHDYWHRTRPDGIFTGMVRALRWQDYLDPQNPHILNLPQTTLDGLVEHVKTTLGADTVAVIGKPDLPCQRIGLMVGFPGAERQIGLLREGIDVLVTGEMHEWETAEYVRDAVDQGQQQAMIVLGHQISEEAGMAYLVEWLQTRLPGDVTIHHVSSGMPWRFE